MRIATMRVMDVGGVTSCKSTRSRGRRHQSTSRRRSRDRAKEKEKDSRRDFKEPWHHIPGTCRQQ
eukprot:490450-Amphidinium_carterae.1